ncbi:LamG-like jellyroll fold domain-containing protein [Metabacillus dongyingensis]|uniref:LamG-like jellyroll fold domain-containing protein n=1 Tax=Metabacillus dongyingensis TaxID=2874282 RepID=UPI003B8D8AB3
MKKNMKDQNVLNEEVKTVKNDSFNVEMDRRTFLYKTTMFVGAAAIGATLVNSFPGLPASAAASSSIMKPKMTLNVISDIHLSDQRTSEKFSAALQDLYEIDPKVDAMVINGDLTNYGTEKEYSKLRELLEQSPKPEKTYMTIGNHEFFNRQGNEVNIKRFTDFIGEDHVYYEKMVRGYSFIFLGSETWGPDGPYKDAANLSEEQLNWLEDTLEKRSKNKKPIFVFLHQQMENTFDASWPSLIQDKELNNILSKYPQSIIFSGHTHQDLHRPSMIQKDFTMINTASVYYTTFYGEESQGLYLEVYEDKVIVKGRDFYRKQWITEAQFTIDIQKKLNSLTAPADITGVAIGTAKTADALGLPTTVDLVTDSGSHPIQAKVTWNVDASNYDPTLKTEQTFTVNGTVTLPNGVENPNNVPLTTSIRVTVKPAEIVAHWKFDEGSGTTVGDSSGNGNTGTLVNNPTWTDSGIGGALAFSGGSRAEFNSSATLNKTGDESVSLWFKTSQPATGNANLFRQDKRFTALQLTSGGQARVAYWPKASSSYKALAFPWTYNDNKWHHYVASYDHSTGLKIYLDGNLVASNTTNLGPLPTVTNKIVLGANESGGEAYNGLLDDVRVFDLALTQDEVRQLSDQQPPTTTDNALSGWLN